MYCSFVFNIRISWPILILVVFCFSVMIEKWLLVFLIVGGTSLVFIICFPIDFYLYRRRKRIARERNKFPNFEPKAVTRAGQTHANVEVKHTIASVWAEDIRRKNVTKGGFARVVSMIKKKQAEEKIAQQVIEVATSLTSKYPRLDPSVTKQQLRPYETYEFPGPSKPKGSHSKSDIEKTPIGNDVTQACHVDSPFPAVPRGKFANLSAAWNENEELVDREVKSFNYGALDSIEDDTESRVPQKKQQCYTIPLAQPTKMMFVRSGDENYTENNTDTDEMQMSSSASEHRYSPNDTKQEFSRPSTEFQQVKYSKMVAKCTSETNLAYQSFGDSRTISDSSSEDTLTEPSQNAINRSIPNLVPVLERSSSDQNMWVTRTNRSPKSKPNSVGPVNKALSYSMEQFIVHESEESILEEESMRSKKKRKKRSFLKKKSNDSIQSLEDETQKY